jgi:hypothetical protein
MDNEIGESFCMHDAIKETTENFLGKLEGKWPLLRSRRRSENDSDIYLKEVVCENVQWIDLVQDRDEWWVNMKAAMNFWFHKRRIYWLSETLFALSEGLSLCYIVRETQTWVTNLVSQLFLKLKISLKDLYAKYLQNKDS